MRTLLILPLLSLCSTKFYINAEYVSVIYMLESLACVPNIEEQSLWNRTVINMGSIVGVILQVLSHEKDPLCWWNRPVLVWANWINAQEIALHTWIYELTVMLIICFRYIFLFDKVMLMCKSRVSEILLIMWLLQSYFGPHCAGFFTVTAVQNGFFVCIWGS